MSQMTKHTKKSTDGIPFLIEGLWKWSKKGGSWVLVTRADIGINGPVSGQLVLVRNKEGLTSWQIVGEHLGKGVFEHWGRPTKFQTDKADVLKSRYDQSKGGSDAAIDAKHDQEWHDSTEAARYEKLAGILTGAPFAEYLQVEQIKHKEQPCKTKVFT